MTRLDLEYLLETARHRGELHRLYDALDRRTVPHLIDSAGHSDAPPLVRHLLHRAYETGKVEGVWKVYRQTC